MTSLVDKTIEKMKTAIERSPRNAYTAEVQLQVIKHHETVKDLVALNLALRLGLKVGFSAEIAKARKLLPRLVAAGLDPNKL